MKYKIVERINPLGKITYISKVKTKFLFIFHHWHSINYDSYNQEISLLSWDHEYDDYKETERAIEKHKEWVKGKFIIKTIKCDG